MAQPETAPIRDAAGATSPDNRLRPSVRDALEATIHRPIAPGTGILADDEGMGTIGRRFERVGVRSTEATPAVVDRLTNRSSGAFRSTAIAVLAFGIAMGYLEAAVVVYLRSAIEVGSVVPAHDPATFGTFEAVEIARELATLVMIAVVGWLAGRTRLERLAWAAIVFGAWDVVYYLGLRLAIGWPPDLATWDVLFLVPVPWVGPVWAPIVVSAALVGSGLAAARRLRAGRPILVGPVRAIGALTGGGLVTTSFLIDTNRVLGGDSSGWTGWPFFGAGMALATAATISALAGRSTPPAPPGNLLQHELEGRPSAGVSD